MDINVYKVISFLFILPLAVLTIDLHVDTAPLNNTVKAHSANISNDRTHLSREDVTVGPVIPNKILVNISINTNLTEVKTKISELQKSKSNNTSAVVTKNNSFASNKTNYSLNSTMVPPSTVKNATLPIVHPIVKKPLVTVHDDEADKIDSTLKKSNVPTPNIMNIDPILSEKKHKRSNYVVPIVAIILSVPLVAALISFLYKRGKDWWLHRNYRRMDYLIEGLYNG